MTKRIVAMMLAASLLAACTGTQPSEAEIPSPSPAPAQTQSANFSEAADGIGKTGAEAGITEAEAGMPQLSLYRQSIALSELDNGFSLSGALSGSDKQLALSGRYSVERMENGVWSELSTDSPYHWSDAVSFVPAGEEPELDFSLGLFKGSLTPGSYRIAYPAALVPEGAEENCGEWERLTLYS